MSSPTMTHAIPCLSYADARTAIQWLVDAFGAEARHVYDGPDNTVSHAEVWFGTSCVMMGSRKDNDMPPRTGQGAVYLVVRSAEEVDRLYERATAHGAKIVISLRDTAYGSHDFGALDPEGNFFGFGTYAPA
ncbi:MAG: VOC family protein [Gemmatimonadaceae bacterium]